MADSKEATVTVSQIAELAGVSSSAVSNWKKRFDDFPAPVGSAPGGRELYLLETVDAWLRRHDRLDPAGAVSRILFRAADLLRGEMPAEDYRVVICSAIILVLAARRQGIEIRPRGSHWLVARIVEELSAADNTLGSLLAPLVGLDAQLASEIVELMRDVEPGALPILFENVLEKGGRYEGTRSSDAINTLLIRLSLEDADSVLDPACGEGGFLLGAARRGGQRLRLYGQEINEAVWRISRQRMMVHGVAANIRHGDSLAHDEFPDLRVDVVLCDPPYGLAVRDEQVRPDPRWFLGLPPKNSGDYLWIQHALYHLKDVGRAYLLLPPASLWRGGREQQMREELLRSGAIEAIVMLPQGTASHTNIELALWVVRRPVEGRDPSPVLLIEAGRLEEVGTRPRLDEMMVDRICEIVRRNREGADLREEDRLLATRVRVLDLLGAEVNLSPRRWMKPPTAADPLKKQDSLLEAVHSLGGVEAQLERVIAEALGFDGMVNATWIPISELVASEVAELIRGIRTRPEDCQSGGTRLLRVRDLGDMRILDDEPCLVDLKQLSGKVVLTEPGDIIFGAGPGRLRAVVDDLGGHALGSSLEALRFRKEWIDPAFAAACLKGVRNQRFIRGTTHAQAYLRELELPLIPADSAHRIRNALDLLAQVEGLGTEVAGAAASLREAIVDAGLGDRAVDGGQVSGA